MRNIAEPKQYTASRCEETRFVRAAHFMLQYQLWTLPTGGDMPIVMGAVRHFSSWFAVSKW